MKSLRKALLIVVVMLIGFSTTGCLTLWQQWNGELITESQARQSRWQYWKNRWEKEYPGCPFPGKIPVLLVNKNRRDVYFDLKGPAQIIQTVTDNSSISVWMTPGTYLKEVYRIGREHPYEKEWIYVELPTIPVLYEGQETGDVIIAH